MNVTVQSEAAIWGNKRVQSAQNLCQYETYELGWTICAGCGYWMR